MLVVGTVRANILPGKQYVSNRVGPKDQALTRRGDALNTYHSNSFFL